MGLIAWIILGGIAGWLASMVMRTDEEQGIGGNIVVGIVGALIGGIIMTIFGGTGVSGLNLYSLFVATIGAIALLWIVRIARV